MRKNICLCIAAAAVCLCSCNAFNQTQPSSDQVTGSVISSSSVSSEVSQTEDSGTEKIPEGKKKAVKGKYDKKVDTVSAQDIYDLTYYSMPETINGTEYEIKGVYEDKPVVVCKSEDSEDSRIRTCGIYDPQSKSYTPAPENNSIIEYLGSDGDNLLFIMNENDVNNISYYNMKTKTVKKVYEYSGKKCIPSMPFIKDNKIYFDAFDPDEEKNIPDVYRYDIETQEISLVYENACKPMMADNKLKVTVRSTEYDYYDKIIDVTDPGDEYTHETKNIMEFLQCGEGVYGIALKQGVYDSFEEFKSKKQILSTYLENGDMLINLKTNDRAIVWDDYTGDKNIPYLYDTVSEKLVSFDEMTPCYYNSYISGDIGLIIDISSESDYRICLFKPKS